MSVKQIKLPWPDRRLFPHAKGHWRWKAGATKLARAYARAVCLEAPRIQTMPDAHIFIEYWPKAYRGDVHNLPGALKAYIDGVADAMGCDDRQFKVHYPTRWAGKSDPGKVVFRIVPSVASIPVVGVIS